MKFFHGILGDFGDCLGFGKGESMEVSLRYTGKFLGHARTYKFVFRINT